MSARGIRAALRVIGTFIGLFGVMFICMSMYFGWRAYVEAGRMSAMQVPLVFGILIGAFFVLAGYSVWFRFSPAAVKQVCACAAFVIFSMILPTRSKSDLVGVIFLVGLLVMFYLYRAVSGRLIDVLWRAEAPQV